MIPLHSDDDDDIVPTWAEPLLDAAHARWLRFREAVTVAGRLVAQSGVAAFSGAYRWLDGTFFRWVVAYATHPLVILATMLLLIPLIFDAANTALALTLGNYTNVVSASVSSIVLMQSLKHHRENKRLHAQHADEIAALRAEVRTAAKGSAKRGQVQPPQQRQRPVRADAEEGAPQ